MIFSDTIIEKDRLFLRNLNVNSQNTAKDVWSTANGSYGFYTVPYEHTLSPTQLYYARYTYKFSTTNQSPTWVNFYKQGGSATWNGTSISNPVAGTEYTRSAIGSLNNSPITITSGTIYNGKSNAISGVLAQAKNVLVYDVTELFEILRAAGTVSTEANLKTWCDNNLDFVPRYTNYDITNKLPSLGNKTFIKKGNLITGNFIEADGMRNYATTADIGKRCYFDDSLSPFGVYNNSGGGTVTHTIVDASTQNSPFYPEHKKIMKITTNGTASPGAGGFVCSHTAAANRIVIERFVAKIPSGYTMTMAYNAQGTGSSVTYLSDRTGTGDWKEYAILYKCGSEGSFSNGGHVYISGSNNTNVTWYVAYCISCIITDNEDLKYFSVLNNVGRFKNKYVFSKKFDTVNIFPNGNFEKQENSFLPSGWSFDTSDVAGEAKASIVQPVNASAGTVGPYLQIKPGCRYKLSYWVKCKQDMTSFLSAIRVFIGTTEVTHQNVAFKSGTKTQLTAALTSGATTVSVKSNANWTTQSYSRLGFRSNGSKSWNDIGTSAGYNGSTGLISGVSGTNTITLNTAYTGNTIPANTYVVESYDGGTYPYPISKGQLPTDNNWKYVEGYFGTNSLWDGAGGGWSGLPLDATQIRLYINIYANTGTVPIKYCDIKIEPVSTGMGARNEQKIQILRGD